MLCSVWSELRMRVTLCLIYAENRKKYRQAEIGKCRNRIMSLHDLVISRGYSELHHTACQGQSLLLSNNSAPHSLATEG